MKNSQLLCIIIRNPFYVKISYFQAFNLTVLFFKTLLSEKNYSNFSPKHIIHLKFSDIYFQGFQN